MKEDQPSLVLQNSKLNHLISIVLKTFFISFGLGCRNEVGDEMMTFPQ